MADLLKLSEHNPDPVLIVGSVAFDNILTPMDKGERILGGSASYASLASSYFAPTRLVGVVGNDFSEEYVARLQKRDIDLEGLQRDLSGPTFFWKGKYHENFSSRETLDIQLNVFEKFEPKLPSRYRNTPYVLLGNIHPSLQLHVLEQMNQQAFVMADTIDLWIQVSRDGLLDVIRRVDLLVINDSEASLLTNTSNVILAGRTLLQHGPRYIIIKKGEHGAVLFHQDRLFSLPAYPVTDLRDPTGAGDSFAGALLGYLAATQDVGFDGIKRAMVYATATASLTVEAFSCDRLESAGPEAIHLRHQEILELIRL
jgi:sugar/nucleoside kinase (ribokinase family)